MSSAFLPVPKRRRQGGAGKDELNGGPGKDQQIQ
jgi:hypothetical protein